MLQRTLRETFQMSSLIIMFLLVDSQIEYIWDA